MALRPTSRIEVFRAPRILLPRPRNVLLLALALLGTWHATAAAAQTSVVGQWQGPWDWTSQINPYTCIRDPANFPELSHAALIPIGQHAGKVLHWRRSQDSQCNPINTTEVWLFNPANPGNLLKIEQSISKDIFCSGHSWDKSGRLTVAGGFPFGHVTTGETYRFDPRVLGVPSIPPGGGTGIVPGNPWSAPFLMSLGRYYPELFGLNRRSVFSSYSGLTVPSGCQVVLGGPPSATNEGNELWQFQDPAVDMASSNPWLHTLVAPPGTLNVHTPTGATEAYTLNPAASPPAHRLDSYPRTAQLAETNLTTPFVKDQILVALDVDTAHFPPNPAGSSWGMELASMTQSGRWELWKGPRSQDAVSGTVWDHYYGPVVVLHTQTHKNRALAFGGSQDPNDPATYTQNWTVHTSVQEFIPATSAPATHAVADGLWKDKAPMLYGRVFHNAVALPSGQILILGGDGIDTHHAIPPISSLPRTIPELYDPGSNPNLAGSSMAVAQSNVGFPTGVGSPTPTPRLYHSVAVLLPDGTIVHAGGHEWSGSTAKSELTGEVYMPPYLFKGTQPVINTAPTAVSFDPGSSAFQVDVTVYQHHVDRVVLLRPAAVTHHFDTDQRYIELAFTGGATGYSSGSTITLTVTPPHETLGPPGWYTLWVVESTNSGSALQDRIPSSGFLVRLN